MSRLRQLLAVVCVAALCCAALPVAASLLTEVPPEQLFLLHRRRIGTVAESDLRAVTRALPVPTSSNVSLDYLKALSSRELHKMIKDRDSDCYGCIERRDLVQRAYEVQKKPTMDERVASQLTVSDRGLMTTEAHYDNVASIAGSFLNADCTFYNNTVYCHPRGI